MVAAVLIMVTDTKRKWQLPDLFVMYCTYLKQKKEWHWPTGYLIINVLSVEVCSSQQNKTISESKQDKKTHKVGIDHYLNKQTKKESSTE